MLSQWQQTVTDAEERFKVVMAGRRAGKTYLAMRELGKVARFPDKQLFYVSPTYRQSKQVMWKPLKAKLRKLNWLADTNETELTAILVNGSTIALKGANNPDSLRGVGLDHVVLDEFAYIHSDTWTEVLRPTLSDTGGSALFISTPAGKGNWSYDMYQKGQQRLQGWQSWQYTTLDGGRVPVAEIEQAEHDLDERTFRQEYLASFETYAGSIYYTFDPKTHVVPYKGALGRIKNLHIGMDFNISPMTASVGIKNSTGLHIIDEITMYGSNTNEMAVEIKNRYPDNKIIVYPDPAGVQRKTSANGQTDIKILEQAGFRTKYHRRHPEVKDRNNAVNSAFHSGKVKIDPKCKELINSLIKHEYKPDTQIPDKTSGYDHYSDNFGYLCEYLFPIRRDKGDFDESETFGMGTF